MNDLSCFKIVILFLFILVSCQEKETPQSTDAKEFFKIPVPSMEKELLVGDFLFINKLDSNVISDSLLNITK